MIHGRILILIIGFYFATSVFAMLAGRLAFQFWLVKRGAEISFFWSGMPGHLENAYVDWCDRNQQRPGRWLPVMRFLLLNALVASIVFVIATKSFISTVGDQRRSPRVVEDAEKK